MTAQLTNFAGTVIGKLVRLSLSFRRGGGHALPGLVVDSLLPKYVFSMLSQLPEGVVVVTGTNGKTTTTKIIIHLLRANGKKALTNPTGSNMVRGVASALIGKATFFGKLPYDIAVLEIDEASARLLVNKIKPRWVLALNVSRDQLDRYGEVDTIAKHIGATMRAATEGVIANANDPHLAKIGAEIAAKTTATVDYFGFDGSLREHFPSDYELAAVSKTKAETATKKPAVKLNKFSGQNVTYEIDGQNYSAELNLSGQHNFLNGTAALALVRKLLPEVSDADLMAELAKVSLAFGRGETYKLRNGAQVELVLVKNPASFRQALASYDAKNSQLMIAINDNIADSRDVSWLWDVSFSPLAGNLVALTSGQRAADMALRLQYDDVQVLAIEPDPKTALAQLSQRPGRKVILATYTAMLQLYRFLSKNAEKI
ncbi:DUF1727 domain-containing protein [Candidatus Saccharibacteria bacterium]|nr:DUF1727 domain-containing protein [Candidatus Saccharibacteria bacterium]